MKQFKYVLFAANKVFQTDPFQYFSQNGVTDDARMKGLAEELFPLIQLTALCILVISLLIAIIKWGITPPAKKSEGLVSVLSWKLCMVIIVAAFAEIAGFMYALFNEISNEVDTTKGSGIFGGIDSILEGYFAAGYRLVIVIGVCLFVLALLVAAILFGVMKDHDKVKENRSWIIRILIAVAVFSLALTLVGIAYELGEKIDLTDVVDSRTYGLGLWYNNRLTG